LLNLTEQYRPKTLSDIYGQDKVVGFFKSVIKNVDNAPRYFLISGPYGTGKSTLCRAFARGLLGSLAEPYYIEIDSGEKYVQENFDALKNIMFRETGGFKVVTLDECHLLGPLVSQQLLKVVEDYYGPLFLFLATTDPQLVPDTLRSRMHHFSLSAFSMEQCKEYALGLLGKESLTVSDKALSLAALNAQGHLRSMVKQVELILFQGEGAYLESYSSVFKGIEVFFTDFGPDDKTSVEALLRFHPAELRSLVMYFFREDIINPSGRFSSVFPRSVIPAMLANYLRLSGLVKEPDDYFSVLLCFRQMMRSVLKGKGL
jgi:DNA polymerase III delta prime subunit